MKKNLVFAQKGSEHNAGIMKLKVGVNLGSIIQIYFKSNLLVLVKNQIESISPFTPQIRVNIIFMNCVLFMCMDKQIPPDLEILILVIERLVK